PAIFWGTPERPGLVDVVTVKTPGQTVNLNTATTCAMQALGLSDAKISEVMQQRHLAPYATLPSNLGVSGFGVTTQTFRIEAQGAELDARGLAPRSVELGLARTVVAVKPIDLPPVVGEMREMVRFELDRHLPFPADDAPFDFLTLPPDGEPGEPASETKRVLIAAADRRVVETAVRLAEEAKLRPVSITVAAHDLLALVKTVR